MGYITYRCFKGKPISGGPTSRPARSYGKKILRKEITGEKYADDK